MSPIHVSPGYVSPIHVSLGYVSPDHMPRKYEQSMLLAGALQRAAGNTTESMAVNVIRRHVNRRHGK